MDIVYNYKDIESCICIDTGSGPVATIFGWVHGNEPSGINATERFLKEVESWKIQILSGKVLLVTHANVEAIKINKREVEKNLNRLFLDENISWDCYEDRRVQELKNILRESDYLLDLHSTSGPSIPFAFAEKQNYEFARKLWISHVIWWWWELEWGVVSGDTENYMNDNGWIGITFEAWNHNDPNGKEIAYQALLNYLSVLEIIDSSYFQKTWLRAKNHTYEWSICCKNKWFSICTWSREFSKNFKMKPYWYRWREWYICSTWYDFSYA